MILSTKPTAPYHIGDLVNIILRDNGYDSSFTNDEKI